MWDRFKKYVLNDFKSHLGDLFLTTVGRAPQVYRPRFSGWAVNILQPKSISW